MINLIDVLFLIDKIFFVAPRVLMNSLIPPMTKFEKTLLNKVIGGLEKDEGFILMEHVRAINCVQRDADDRQVRMYKFVPFKYSWKRNLYFQGDANTEFTICRFEINFPNGKKLNGTLKAVNRVLVAINFGENAKFYRNETEFSLKLKK